MSGVAALGNVEVRRAVPADLQRCENERRGRSWERKEYQHGRHSGPKVVRMSGVAALGNSPSWKSPPPPSTRCENERRGRSWEPSFLFGEATARTKML